MWYPCGMKIKWKGDALYRPSAVDFSLILWSQGINIDSDFTQGGRVGEVGTPKGESEMFRLARRGRI